MDRNGCGAQLRESGPRSWREGEQHRGTAVREEVNGVSAPLDAAKEVDSAPSCPERAAEVSPSDLRTEGVSHITSEVAAGEDKHAEEKALTKSFSRGTIDSALGGCAGAGSSAASTTALSMRSKSVGTTSSSAVSPMMLPLSPHGGLTVGAETTPVADTVTTSVQTPEANASESSSAGGAHEEGKNKDSEVSACTTFWVFVFK
jgi:hypothetical protein